MSFCLSILLAVFRTVVIPVQFQDVRFSCSMEELSSITTRSATYFNRELHGSRTVEFCLNPIFTASNSLSHYGGNSPGRKDTYLFEAAYDAIRAADETTDFSNFDNVMFIFAGKSEADGAGEEYIWPQQDRFENHSITLICDGRRINEFASSCELGPDGKLAGIGVFCHELAHGLGLPDFYDTDGESSGGLSKGLREEFSLMDGGDKLGGGHSPASLGAIELDLLGAGSCTMLGKGSWTMEDVARNGRYMKFLSETENEYWLFECRKGKGLVVYHIDRSSNDAGYSDYFKRNLTAAERWTLNQVNCNPQHECASIVSLHQNDRNSVSLVSWGGSYQNISISDIKLNADGSVSFNVNKAVSDIKVTSYQDAALISWTTDPSLKISESEVSWQSESGESVTQSVSSYSAGAFSFMAENLSPGTEYAVTIKSSGADGVCHYCSTRFSTKTVKEGTIPFIYLRDVARNDDGSFKIGARLPLRIFNAPGADSVEWFLDQNRIKAGPDGTCHITTGGTIRAVVHYSNGEVETFMKALKVK